ncbi:hypothetical protein B8b_024 [Pseudoalteromonas phage B8b]|uniref:Uncharacterized protein n=1 Tax=Pseudoalteromonas phage B8b TaxID=1506997 RepID=A0A076G662_9CAUD|nr:hypothetical protein B8b_024 [Pseudoalteromonas phage B8b]|tara:strand:- start:843 stop:1445 length:603 start_codon:yes stop_codon:yes gene_type:complete
MNIRYDDETQTALDELDRNIENRHKYLSVNFSFNWQDFHQDPVLQELQKIKNNLLATATMKTVEFDDQELASIGSGEPFLDETDMHPVNLKTKQLVISTPLHKNSEFEQAFNSHFKEQAEKAICNFGKAVINIGAAAEVTAEQLRTAMEKMRPVKAPVFDETDLLQHCAKMGHHPIPVPRTPCHGKWRSDIEQFNKEESE